MNKKVHTAVGLIKWVIAIIDYFNSVRNATKQTSKSPSARKSDDIAKITQVSAEKQKQLKMLENEIKRRGTGAQPASQPKMNDE